MQIYGRHSEAIVDKKFDWWTIFIYLVLVVMGWFSIYSSSYVSNDVAFYSPQLRSGMQLIWIGISLILAFGIMLLDDRYIYIYSYPIYVFAVILMVLTLFIGKEVNGAKSWFGFGSIGIQSVEVMKFGTALAIARFAHSYDFGVTNWRSLLIFSALVVLPVVLALLQNDTGSALVFLVLFIVLYREGVPSEFYAIIFLIAFVLIMTFAIDRTILLLIIALISVMLFAVSNKAWNIALRYIMVLCALTILISAIMVLITSSFNNNNFIMVSLLMAVLITLPFVIIFKKNNHRYKILRFIMLFVVLSLCTIAIDFAFDNILQDHQRIRILNLFGVIDDPKGASYNVTQSMIAIGSGGFAGKGFLEGTQTKYSYVPEQTTDFIFCTIGEEQGFVGSVIVIILFGILIYRLMCMAERNEDKFTRIYCYSVAALFFFHVFINISMTIGLFPVIGIPLPFFSYGGSSMMAFTIMLFCAIRLDNNQESNIFR